MRYLFLIYCFLFFTNLHAQNRYTIGGGTTSTTSTSTVSPAWINASDYGWSASATAAANSTALTNAQTAAHAAAKGVLLGGGTYAINTFDWDGVTSFSGTGSATTFLQSASAVPLFEHATNTFVQTTGKLTGFTLDGNNIGTIGLNLWSMAFGAAYDVRCERFTQYGLYLYGVEEMKFDFCFFEQNVIGLKALSNPNTTAGNIPTNFNVFSDCYFRLNTTNSVNIAAYSASFRFRGCDFETSGTTGNSATGAIVIRGMSPNTEGVDAVFDGCWMELNYGGYVLDLGSSTGRTIIQNTLIRQFGGSATGVSNASTNLFVSGSYISGFTTDITTSGTGNTTILASNVGVHAESGSGVYTVK